MYVFVPFYLLNNHLQVSSMHLMISISLLCLVGLCIGYYAKILTPTNHHICEISFKRFNLFFLLFFLGFIVITMSTAKYIPLFLAFENNDVISLATAREHFLKAREGYGKILGYLSAILSSSLIPYLIVQNFKQKTHIRLVLFLSAYIFSFVFLEKAFFLKFVIPLLVFYFLQKDFKRTMFLLFLIPFTIYLNTYLSRFGASDSYFLDYLKNNPEFYRMYCDPTSETYKKTNYFTAKYVICASENRSKFIKWRILSVPVFSASDSIEYFKKNYDQFLMGRTSFLVSLLTHQNNIKFERMVFRFEWGRDVAGTASTNAFFGVEQYVNFGFVGVFISSILVGALFRWILMSQDLALLCLLPVFLMSLFFGGFMSTMLSGIFIFINTSLFF